MTLPDMNQVCEQLAQQLKSYLSDRNISAPVMVGIRTGGVWVAEHLHKRLELTDPLGSVDISFYRDDFTRSGLHPQAASSDLPDSIEGRDVILVDDVIMSGRTVRAAMNELFDYGRPASVTLVALVDIGRRELPLQPDLCGLVLDLEPGQLVKLSGPDPLELTLL
ncbi:bifunctional pyr operon transcriptional regulator/uracil phosphoribosyltransferase PyrR [Parathalassolituus penaei]|uniref:Bifunctional pyr operon transcriptional regulator/uracil phosphoribosyltransferase PyrR n=1 Tax=Parathalassolituus penaei TaxID=2997323 RepID=A0A9X3EEL5_9GAMM|nr:bifunctional pyr operon transcriptional regulator/uracil phosphoribosyltransferase PyrR [Parathalassolituus penaei]MCY0965790.1 bifunctional pyr operon transcriptional regulator/uracil phosphoribosyltransferase PyrR [Parathalassolituus penaei]